MISVSYLAPALAWGYNILVSTACPLWKKRIIYVGNVYDKNIKIITLIMVLPGSTRLRSNETRQHFFLITILIL